MGATPLHPAWRDEPTHEERHLAMRIDLSTRREWNPTGANHRERMSGRVSRGTHDEGAGMSDWIEFALVLFLLGWPVVILFFIIFSWSGTGKFLPCNFCLHNLCARVGFQSGSVLGGDEFHFYCECGCHTTR